MLCWLPFKTWSQNEAAIWYFGENAGLDFNSGAPVALTDGALITQEGCATISDGNGNLLFYTNGVTVWDRTHNLMPNGTGLLGHDSSSQSAIVVPNPGNLDLYYVFTVDQKGEANGFQYSVVDMTLNGGLGDVTLKNIPLTTPVAEKLTAVEHANGTDIWVLVHTYGNDQFLAYLVTPTGVITTPVVSSVGRNLPLDPGSKGTGGYMKISPDGQYLAYVNGIGRDRDLFRFDALTGQVSDFIDLNPYFPVPNFSFISTSYGVEFSSDSSKLYITSANFYPNYTWEHNIHQFDLSTYSAAAILASGLEIAPMRPGDEGALQLGIDGKIYVAEFGQNALSVINNPNLGGLACNYVPDAVPLMSGSSRLGLPPFIQSFFVVGLRVQHFCLGDATQFEVTSTEPILSIAWDFGDGNTSTLETPTHTYAAAGTYPVSVTVTTTADTKTESKDITIYETPVASSPTDLVGCTSYGSYNIDLASFDTTVLGTQDPNDFNVTYFLSQADADSNVNALEDLHSFDYGTTPVYVRVSNANNGQCYDTTQFNIIAREAPLVDTITDWTVCDDDTDGFFTFDLSQKNAEIFNGQDETKFEILYFVSQADADAGTNALPTNYTNTAATETIFVRFQNSTYNDCYRTGSFMIEVIPGVTANRPNDLSLCDDNNDGEAIFNLGQTELEVIGIQNPGSLNISYHESQGDADTGTNPLNANNYLSTAYQNTIFVRVENASDTNCYDTTSFDLIIYDTPVVPSVTDWQVCDSNNDGFYLFNLSEKENEILNGASGVSVSFYVSQTDAETSQNTITGNYQNTSNPQTIHFRLENTNNSKCYNLGSFQVQVFDIPMAYTASDIIICDSDETGSYFFDLSQKDDEVLNGQNPLFYDVSYHGSENDAFNNLSPLSKADYQNTNLNQTIWARIQHTDLESCFDISSFNLFVTPLPQMNIEERYVICPDSPDLVIDGGDFENYSWQDANGNEIGNQPTMDITALGDYSLTVTQTTNGITCENSVSFEVLSSGAPESLKVETNGFSDRIDVTVNATGTGPFEYSVDGENYQVSNEFKVFPGKYTVYVRDLEECRILSEEIIAIGYQRFFTPNGDGSNEYWNIIGGELYPESQLYIYDRYGKLLVQVDTNSNGWDGRLNGVPLPESDYWFSYSYSDEKTVSGHFSLKR
ncbi:gliding motility-associated C-terminal domain-containing protein [Maribacter dokdonensis]|nr:gliding motility-associated C-terminal domain-containing protein [Maribacter dokdonensis]